MGINEPIGGVVGELIRAPDTELVRCSFCGRQPPDTGRIVSGGGAFICEHCIETWGRNVGLFEPTRRHLQQRHLRQSQPLFVEEVQPTGPGPEDPDAARAQIEEAFASYATLSDDGQSLPYVEGGENLGPTVVAAQQRHQVLVLQDAQVGEMFMHLVFIDADHAAVWFSISIDGKPVSRWHRGDAVLVDGTWKTARSTFCELMALAGVECPPPNPQA